MAKPKICLSLKAPTLIQNVKLVEKYNRCIDMVELRVDCLNEDEQFFVRKFPAMINVPCILSIRRESDGGLFSSGEFSRTALFGRALSFANPNPAKNFAYVDFEEDFHIPGLQDAAMAFGVRIIRSFYDFDSPVENIRERYESMRKTIYEIPKIAFMPKSLKDVTRAFKESENIIDYDHILVALGSLGVPSRVLSSKANSFLTYVSASEFDTGYSLKGHIDPVSMNDMYNFRGIDEETKFFGACGNPLKEDSNPLIINAGFRSHGINAVYVPMESKNLTEAIEFADQVKLTGFTVSSPFKFDVLDCAEGIDNIAQEIGCCNLLLKKNDRWIGYNTEAVGFEKVFIEFLGFEKLKRKKIAIIGSHSYAHAACYIIQKYGGRACIFDIDVVSAKDLSMRYGFEFSYLDESNAALLDKYSDIIIQTIPGSENPIDFYHFRGTEFLFDTNFDYKETDIIRAAKEAGCKYAGGNPMMKNIVYGQFKYFTGNDYEGTFSE